MIVKVKNIHTQESNIMSENESLEKKLNDLEASRIVSVTKVGCNEYRVIYEVEKYGIHD